MDKAEQDQRQTAITFTATGALDAPVPQTWSPHLESPPAYTPHPSTAVPHSTQTTPFMRHSIGDARLEKLIAIPSATSARESPFLRAYPPSLASYSISASEFLQFVDTLNHVSEKSPPLQVLSAAGDIVGLVPEPTAQIVGTAINLGAEVGSAALTYGRSEMELRKANKELFGPRGLKVEIAKLDAVARLTGMPILDTNGKFNKNVALLKPIDGSDMDISMHSRRLDAMHPWIAPLEVVEGPRVSASESKFGQFQAKLDEKEKAKKEKKTLVRRQELQQEFDKDGREIESKFDKDMRQLEEELAKDMKEIQKYMDRARQKQKPERQNEELDKLERKKLKAVEASEKEKAKRRRAYEKDLGKLEIDKIKHDKEEKSMREILWLIVREIDSESAGETVQDVLLRYCS